MSSSATTTRGRPPGETAATRSKQRGQGPSLSQQRRRRQRRLRRLRRAGILVVLLAVLATGGWLVAFSSVLATEQVTVSGTRLLSVDRVETAAAVPIGLPLARQDTAAIADRVAALPAVDSVTVERRWPNSLGIEVVERKPLVAAPTGNGYVLVDHTGTAFEEVARPPAGVVTVSIDSGNAALLADAGTIATNLPGKLRERVASITARTPDSFQVKITSGPAIFWGDADESALKGEVALVLLKKHPKAIDVSAPHSPAIR
jgi:cell division protein FtsQ